MNQAELHKLFQLTPQTNAPEFVVYSSKLSPRLDHTCKFMFEHVLNCKYSITDNKQVFKNSTAFKISYSATAEKDIFHIAPHELIFKTGVENMIPKGNVKNFVLYFYNNDVCSLGYDIFSSVFYFISCYQEWLPFEADSHGRFELQQSIQYKHEQHIKPLVNIWIEELKQALLKFYPTLKFPEKKFQYLSTLDVDNLYAYKGKGSLRTWKGISADLVTFDFGNLSRRLKAIKNKIKDPFDIYDEVNDLSKRSGVPVIYFFLQRSGKRYDRTIDPGLPVFKEVLGKITKAGRAFGLHPSYDTLNSDELLKEELDILKNNAGQITNLSRQHYLRFDIKRTPKQLAHHGIIADFSLGFASGAGYRAGTFTPFHYYDLENEKPLDIVMVPFVVMDGAYFIYSDEGVAEAQRQMFGLANDARRLNGIFVTIFHERTFDAKLFPGFGELYRSLMTKLA